MSKLEVDQIDPQSGTTLTLGTSGDTIVVPSGVTFNSSAATNTLPSSVVTTTGTQTLTNKSIVATQLTGTITPSDDTVTLAKMAPGTDGNIISYDASGNPVAVATGSAAQVLTSAGAGAPPTFATATVPDNAITLAKMASGTDGNIISYDASGNPVAIATGNDGQVLTSAGAGAQPAFETLPVGGITMADQWRLTTTFAGDTTAMQNLERVDTKSPGFIGTAMSESAGIFTFPSTGIYSIFFNVCGSATTAQLYHTCAIQVTTDGSNYATAASNDINYYGGTSYGNSLTQYVFDVTSTSTHKVRFNIDAVSTSTNTLGNSNETQTGMTFIRLGDT